MPYRDEREALRVRNAELEEQLGALRAAIARLRRPRRRPTRAVAWALGGCALGAFVAASAGYSAPNPARGAGGAEVTTPPPPSAHPSPSAPATQGANHSTWEHGSQRTSEMPKSIVYREPGSDRGPQHVFRAVVRKAKGGDPPFKVGEECTIRLSSRPWDEVEPGRGERGELFCLFNMECGVRASGGFARCWFDERGLPHGQPAFVPKDSYVKMDGRDVEFTYLPGGHGFTLELTLDERWPGFGRSKASAPARAP